MFFDVILRCHYLFELAQTLCTAEFSAALVRLEDDRRVAVGATVLADEQVVHVAEAETTAIAADFVDDVLMHDLMFALPEDQRKTFCHKRFTLVYYIHRNLDNSI